MKKYFCISTACLICLLFLTLICTTGCEKSDPAEGENESKIKENVSSALSQKNTNSSGSDLNVPSHITMDLQEKVKIDADVLQSAEEKATATATVKSLRFDTDKAIELLCKDKEIESKEYISEYDSDMITFKDGSYIDCSNGSLSYASAEFDKYNTCFISIETDSLYNLDKYTTNQEFNFCKKADAEKKISNILKNLGLNTNSALCVSLDYKTLSQEEQVINVRPGDNNKKHSWDENDNAYYFKFYQSINGVNIFEGSHGNYEDSTEINGTFIEVVYNKKGIINFSAQNIYNEISLQSMDNKIMDVSSAINLLDKKLGTIIISNDLTVKKISLVYLPCNDGSDQNKITLTPAWCFLILEKYEPNSEKDEISEEDIPEDIRIASYTIFDAVTGKEII